MHILAFDTCFDACSVAVARHDDGGCVELASALERFETGHAERLVPMIDEAMRAAGLDFSDVDRIAVTEGPGTFTGTRIGIAAARALALATRAEIVAASSLAVMAQVAAAELALPALEPGVVVAVDARRGEVYAQIFDACGRQAQSPPQLLTVADAARLGAPASLLVVGSAAEAVAAVATDAGRPARAALPKLLPAASSLARMAGTLAPLIEPLRPLYLRPPDAKPQTGKSIARAP
jgi:tRNA threonylcarbamoyladenosine biosynthesis protein TsaB